jgi:homoserine dehydrogenase
MLRADLALVGFGHVGRRFALLLEEYRTHLIDQHQLECRIVGITTGRHGAVFDPHGVAVRGLAASTDERVLGPALPATDLIARLQRSEAELRIVVEITTLSIRDGQPAIVHVEAALRAGCHVITANKGPVAFAYRPLNELAAERGVSFLFESAVMDGIPIFNLVNETMPGLAVSGFRGIVNTTTQHILSALEAGEPFDGALKRMQDAGIAEADPSHDLDGWDAAAKTAALANVLMGAEITPHHVARDSVSAHVGESVRRAAAQGRRRRLIASAVRNGDVVEAAVRLTDLDARELLATLPNTANALILTTDLLGEVAVCQMAGTVTQTAYGLLSDLITLRRRAARHMPS